jgi:hypothetical protein
MIHLCCRKCATRFAPGTSLAACPECGMPPEWTADAESLIGFKLCDQPTADPVPEVVAISLPVLPSEYTSRG